ncbi:MAG: FecR domain-containing protein [Phycisphaeraceae bacterium]|nr:FecR domain-containing protein [Phycisphaeraceae bacterium]
MTSSSHHYRELLRVSLALLDGSVSSQEFAWLDSQLATNPNARSFYLDLMRITAQLEQRAKTDGAPEGIDQDLDFFELEAGLDPDQDVFSDTRALLDIERRAAAELIDLSDELDRREREKNNQDQSTHREQEVDPAQTLATTPPSSRVIVIPKPVAWLSLAAAIGLIAVLIVSFSSTESDQTHSAPTAEQAPAEQAPTDNAAAVNHVATIRRAVGASWSGDTSSLRGGLPSQVPVTLEQGLVEILFGDGAAVIVQAPTTFEQTSPNSMRLVSGRLVATVPESAHGFVVATPSAFITDYGTEFGVIVDQDGETRTEVFTGHVGIAPSTGGAEVQLKTGQAAVTAATGQVSHTASEPLAFVRRAEFEARSQSEASARARWLSSIYDLKRDPALIGLYLFDDADRAAGELLNHAPASASAPILIGELVGKRSPGWTAGRIPGKRAMHFVSSQEQAVVFNDWPVHAPDEEITVSLWFRTSSNREDWNLILSQWDVEIGDACRFHLAVLGNAYGDSEAAPAADRRVCLHIWSDDAQSMKDQARSGGSLVQEAGWVHTAFTITAGGKVRLYVNGREVDLPPLDYAEPTLSGSELPLMLGGKANDGIFFDGLIDELVILKRAMTPGEIAALYSAGAPDAEDLQ